MFQVADVVLISKVFVDFLIPLFGELSRYNDGLWAGWPGFDFRQGQGFSLLHSVQTCSGAYPAAYAMGTGEISAVVKRPGRDAEKWSSWHGA
jgi:hypothetical protein